MATISDLINKVQSDLQAKVAASQPAPTPAPSATPTPTAPQNVDTTSPGYVVTGGGDPASVSLGLQRADWNLLQNVYKPLETGAINQLTDLTGSTEKAGQQAIDATKKAFSGTHAMTLRELARQGVAPSASQEAAITRHEDLTKSLAVAGAANKARATQKQANITGLTTLRDLATQIASGASQAADAAAGIQSSRDAASKTIQNQQDQALINTAITTFGAALL